MHEPGFLRIWLAVILGPDATYRYKRTFVPVLQYLTDGHLSFRQYAALGEEEDNPRILELGVERKTVARHYYLWQPAALKSKGKLSRLNVVTFAAALSSPWLASLGSITPQTPAITTAVVSPSDLTVLPVVTTRKLVLRREGRKVDAHQDQQV